MPTPSPNRALTELIARFELNPCLRLAPNTVQSYRYDWDLFAKWCNRLGREALPATTETIAVFLADRLESGNKVASARRRLSAIVNRHREENQTAPDTSEIHRLLNTIERARGERPLQKKALTVEQLRAIVVGLASTPYGVRDRAMLVLGFASALRRSNIVALNMEDVTIEPEQSATLFIGQEKNHRTGRGREVGVPYGSHESTCPVRCVQAWLKIRGAAAPGPLFIRMDRRNFGGRLRPGYVAMILQEGVKRIGLRSEDYGAHSLRAGLVTAAAEAGVSELVIADQTGHRSLDMVRQYFRKANLHRANAAASIGL
jgi:site-specific recombinase XerD